MKAIKGFDRNLQCRGFRFEVGKTYTAMGKIKACHNGFHAIPDDAHPLSVLEYYPPAGSVFRYVEISGVIDRDGNKIASEILTVGDVLPDLATEAVKWVMERAKPEGDASISDNGLATASGDQGAATASGYRGAAMATGWNGYVSGSDGNALFAVERDDDYNVISVACGIVGKGGIKPDTWYRAKDEKLVEAK